MEEEERNEGYQGRSPWYPLSLGRSQGGGFGGHQTGGGGEEEREEATKDLQNFKQKRLFNPKMFFQITCFMIGYVLTQPVRFAHVVVKGWFVNLFVKVKVFEVVFIVICWNHI